MSDNFGYPERRKNKNDKRSKMRKGVYKRGGKNRTDKSKN